MRLLPAVLQCSLLAIEEVCRSSDLCIQKHPVTHTHTHTHTNKCESDRYDLFMKIFYPILHTILLKVVTLSTHHTYIMLTVLSWRGLSIILLYKQAGYQFTLPDFWWLWKASMSPVAHLTLSGEGEKACLTTGTWSGWMTCFPVYPMRAPSSACLFRPSKSVDQREKKKSNKSSCVNGIDTYYTYSTTILTRL